VNEDRENGGAPTRFSEWMNKPGIIQRPGNYDMFLRGIATQPQQAQDIFFSEEVSTPKRHYDLLLFFAWVIREIKNNTTQRF